MLHSSASWENELYQIWGEIRYTIDALQVYLRFPMCCSVWKVECLKSDFVLFVHPVKLREGWTKSLSKNETQSSTVQVVA